MDKTTVSKKVLVEVSETLKRSSEEFKKLMHSCERVMTALKNVKKSREDAVTKLEIMLGVNKLAQQDAEMNPDQSVLAFLVNQHQRISEVIAILKTPMEAE